MSHPPQQRRSRSAQGDSLPARLRQWWRDPSRPLRSARRRIERLSRKLNRRLLLQSSVGAVLLAVAGYAHWQWRIHRTAAQVRWQTAQTAEPRTSPAATNDLAFVAYTTPRSAADLWEYAQARERQASTAADRVALIELLRQIVTLPDAPLEARLRLAELALEQGDVWTTDAQLDEVLAQEPRHPAAWRCRARALFRRADMQATIDPQSARRTLKTAIELNPAEPELRYLLARWLRDYATEQTAGSRAWTADETIDAMVLTCSENAEAFLYRHLYRRRYGLPVMVNDLATALKLAPTSLEALLAAAGEAAAQGKLEHAENYYQQAHDQGRTERRVYLGLAQLRMRSARPADAIAACRQGLREVGASDPWLNLKLAECLAAGTPTPEVAGCLHVVEEQLALRREYWPAQQLQTFQNAIEFIHARVQIADRDYEGALQRLDHLLQAADVGLASDQEQPLEVELHYLRAVCLMSLTRWRDAAEAFEAAWRSDPHRADHLLAAGKAWEQKQDWLAATRCYEKAAALNHDSPQAQQFLAHARQQLAQPSRQRGR